MLTNKTQYHQGRKDDLSSYRFLPLGEAPGSLGANLAHPNFLTILHSTKNIRIQGGSLSAKKYRGRVRDPLGLSFSALPFGMQGYQLVAYPISDNFDQQNHTSYTTFSPVD